ncbi:MAG: lipoate--protein ligase family protein [Gemmatimonadales bacterium]
MNWRVLLEPVGRAGADNMALDCALLDEAQRTGTAWLRLYRWDPPCLSLGRNESARARYDRSAIERLGLDVVRRPTGGRAVWHEHEVTYAVAAPVDRFGSLRNAYRLIHERLAAALRSLGADAHLAPDRPAPRPPIHPGACFAAAAGGEVLVDGRKLVGSAQLRQGTVLLQHGSILLEGSQETVRAVSRQPSANGHATTLRRVLGHPVTFDEVVAAITSTWGGPWTPSASVRPRPPLSPHFSDPDWTWRR